MYFHLHTNWHIRTKRHAQIEEGAYAQAKGDRLWTRDFCSISLLNLLILTGGNMLVSTFPFYLSELGATKVIIGLVASIYYATSLIMRPIAGWWLDHRSRKFGWHLLFGGTSAALSYVASLATGCSVAGVPWFCLGGNRYRLYDKCL